MDATVTWTDKMAFSADVDGHQLVIDASAEHGGQDKGPRPKPLLLVSLAGCTAMDVISILKKMRQDVTSFRVRAEASLSEGEHPHTLEDMVVVYEVEGDVRPDRLWRAITLSQDTYCGVSAMLKKHTGVGVKVVLNGQELPRPE